MQNMCAQQLCACFMLLKDLFVEGFYHPRPLRYGST
jgi:hypothetical protein